MIEINENAILDRFNSYLEDMNINDACSMALDDVFGDQQTKAEVFYECLLPRIVVLFAKKYESLNNVYDNPDDDPDYLNDCFDTWAGFSGLSPNLADLVATHINETAERYFTEVTDDNTIPGDDNTGIKRVRNAFDDVESDDENDDDENLAFTTGDWARLTDEQRRQKIAAFLKALARAHIDIADRQPFWKTSIGHRPDPYGNSFGDAVKKGDHYGPSHRSNESYVLPNTKLMEGFTENSATVEARMKRYQKFMRDNPRIGDQSYAVPSQKKDLIEAQKLRDKAAKKGFGQSDGFDSTSLYWSRSGRQK
jgi:hypothetical protein